MDLADCVFGGIVARRLPAHIRYEDDKLIVFDNRLTVVPVMLLIVPKRHLTQSELWSDGPLLSRIGLLADRLGRQYSPEGFRVLSNFGDDGLQTVTHGHVHVIGGVRLGLYV